MRSSSTLLAASTTGLPPRRSTRATASSVAVAPTEASTTSSTASADSIARSAWAATRAANPRASGSHPPVSTTVKRRPAHCASYATRSRVTPGTSWTTASRRPRMRFTRVDLPTFGRPTTARTGKSTRSCSAEVSSASSVQPPASSPVIVPPPPLGSSWSAAGVGASCGPGRRPSQPYAAGAVRLRGAAAVPRRACCPVGAMPARSRAARPGPRAAGSPPTRSVRWCRRGRRRRRPAADCASSVLSYVSRRSRSAAVDRWSVLPSCRERRCARASDDAVRKILSGAAGATTVPMSRPSATTRPGSISRCWAATRTSRTPGVADTGLTATVTARDRISRSTGRPSTETRGWSGSVDTSTLVRRARPVTATASSGSTPSRRTAQVTARYIAPVSR